MSFIPPASYRLWLLLSFPAALMIFGTIAAGWRQPEDSEILHVSGELSAWALIAAMLASPLSLVLRGWRGAPLVGEEPEVLRRGGLRLRGAARLVLSPGPWGVQRSGGRGVAIRHLDRLVRVPDLRSARGNLDRLCNAQARPPLEDVAACDPCRLF